MQNEETHLTRPNPGPPPDILIRGVESEADRRAVRELLASEFEYRPGLGNAFARLYDSLLDGDAQVSPACSRVALRDGRVVGHVLLVPRRICIDGMSLPGGILAMTVVAPEHRGQGIGGALVEEAESLARSKGLAILHVAGDLGFYGRFGYVEAYVSCQAEMGAAPGPPRSASVLRQVSPRDAEVLARMSGRNVPVGAAEPTPDRWRWVLETRHPFGMLAANESHLGYRATEDFCLALQEGNLVTGFLRAAGDGQTLTVYEAGAESRLSARGLSDALSAFAVRSGYRRTRLHLPPNNPLMGAHASPNPSISEDPELLARVLDPKAVLQGLLPALQHRLAAFGSTEKTVTVSLSIDDEGIALSLRDGQLSVQDEETQVDPEWRVSLPGIALTRAVLGTDSLAERIARRPEAAPPLVDALGALFPPRQPFFWLADSL
ncbi:MAG: N-acetyltransferase [Candidatus Latescibacteria bacterium]|jgi:predicted N-acetyltransferase YhbS|nr:N-acetyltransferase [Candidatus Latescibacterota bacterium]